MPCGLRCARHGRVVAQPHRSVLRTTMPKSIQIHHHSALLDACLPHAIYNVIIWGVKRVELRHVDFVLLRHGLDKGGQLAHACFTGDSRPLIPHTVGSLICIDSKFLFPCSPYCFSHTSQAWYEELGRPCNTNSDPTNEMQTHRPARCPVRRKSISYGTGMEHRLRSMQISYHCHTSSSRRAGIIAKS